MLTVTSTDSDYNAMLTVLTVTSTDSAYNAMLTVLTVTSTDSDYNAMLKMVTMSIIQCDHYTACIEYTTPLTWATVQLASLLYNSLYLNKLTCSVLNYLRARGSMTSDSL